MEKAAGLPGDERLRCEETIERRAVRATNGGAKDSLDDVQPRKFGRLWRVWFS